MTVVTTAPLIETSETAEGRGGGARKANRPILTSSHMTA